MSEALAGLAGLAVLVGALFTLFYLTRSAVAEGAAKNAEVREQLRAEENKKAKMLAEEKKLTPGRVGYWLGFLAGFFVVGFLVPREVQWLAWPAGFAGGFIGGSDNPLGAMSRLTWFLFRLALFFLFLCLFFTLAIPFWLGLFLVLAVLFSDPVEDIAPFLEW